MRILVFDPFHGAAGDMITASLLDLGADKETVVRAMSSVVEVPEITTVKRCGISAIGIDTKAGHAHRSLEEVLEIVDTADASPEVIGMAKRVFFRISAGENEIHGGKSHFHEVGADDAIADVLGACSALCSLGVDRVVVMPVATGRGYINSEHGKYPVPAPATLSILKEGKITLRFTDEEHELCTPTGAALLSEFRTPDETEYTGCVLNTGYGAGKRDPPNTPNVLRTFIVETEDASGDSVDILETNVDDATGEVISHVIQRLLDTGANDACAVPVIMKKGRPGYMIKVICKSADVPGFVRILSEELGTLGVRHMQNVHRSVLEREITEVPFTHDGRTWNIRVKSGYIDGMPATIKAEYEDLKAVAKDSGLPLKKIARYAENEALKRSGNN